MKISDVMMKEEFVIVFVGMIFDEVEKILQKYKIEKFFFVDDQNKLKGFIIIKDIEKVIEFLNLFKDIYGCLIVGVVVGVIGDIMICVKKFVEVNVDVIVIDIVYGYF